MVREITGHRGRCREGGMVQPRRQVRTFCTFCLGTPAEGHHRRPNDVQRSARHTCSVRFCCSGEFPCTVLMQQPIQTMSRRGGGLYLKIWVPLRTRSDCKTHTGGNMPIRLQLWPLALSKVQVEVPKDHTEILVGRVRRLG